MMGKLKVGIDCWALRLNGGGARYVFESILEYLLKENIYILLFLHEEAYKCIQLLQSRLGCLAFKNCVKIKIPDPTYIKKYDKYVDIYYSPFNNLSFRYLDKPILSVIHDVQERYLPEMFSSEDLEGRIEDYDDIVRSSQNVITISKFCKESLIKFCQVNDKKVHIVYNAPQQALLDCNDSYIDTKIISLLKNTKYILYPANFYPHKNHETLLKAYINAKNHNISLPTLVLVGRNWNNNIDITNIIEKNNLDIKILSDISAASLAWLYKNCIFVCIPSLFEGFCLPAIEAFSFGKQVVCSNLPILREITFNKGEYFSATSPTDILQKINSTLSNIDKIDKESLEKKQVAALFNWDKSAKKTLNLIYETYKNYYQIDEKEIVNFSFIIFRINEDKYLINETLNSIFCQKKIRLRFNVVIFDEVGNLDIEKDFSNSLFEYFIKTSVVLIKKDLLKHNLPEILKNGDLFSIMYDGNIISKNYCLNLVKSEKSARLIVGEIHQVHENKERLFESACYFRIKDSHYILKGHLYLEMLVFQEIDLILEIIKNPLYVWTLLISELKKNKICFLRCNLGEVRHRTHLKQPKVISSLEKFTPTLIGNEKNLFDYESMKKNKSAIDFINNNLVTEIGYLGKIPKINELNRISILCQEN